MDEYKDITDFFEILNHKYGDADYVQMSPHDRSKLLDILRCEA